MAVDREQSSLSPLDSKWGAPLQPPRSDSLDSVLIVEPTLGLELSHAAVNAPLGATPYSENFIIRDGALEPRPMLSLDASVDKTQPVDRILGGAEIVDVAANRYPFVTGSTRPAWFSNGSWSVLSYVSAYGVNQQPTGGNVAYWDVTQIYDATSNQNCAIFANASQQTLYCWQSGTTVYSTLTGAPAAKYVTTYNDYVLAFNLAQGLVQRVQWNDRGSMSSWTGGLSGFQDLLDMRGQGTRIISQDNRVVLFSDYEIWGGTPAAFPFIFDFEPIDRNVGCPYPWTVANTPKGLMFLSNDYEVYLLSKFGGPAMPIGLNIQKYLRENIDQPSRAWASYDRTYNVYQLYFPTKGGSGFPQQALLLHLNLLQGSGPAAFYSGTEARGAWALQTFDKTAGKLSLTRGFEAQQTSAATTWSALSSAQITWQNIAMTWNDLAGVVEQRATHVGSSTGTMYYLNSAATSDNGTPCRSIWRSTALFGFQPNRQKTMSRIRLDYQADSTSNVTLEASRTQGASFDPGIGLTLPANSALSESVAHFYSAARYPLFQVSSEGERYRLYRFWLSVRAGGR